MTKSRFRYILCQEEFRIFEKLLNFGFRRNATQAIGFYLAYLIMSGILFVIYALALVLWFGEPYDYHWAMQVLMIFFYAYSALVTIAVVRAKGFGNEYYLLVIVSLILARYSLSIGGLFPALLLTTMEIATSKKKNEDLLTEYPS